MPDPKEPMFAFAPGDEVSIWWDRSDPDDRGVVTAIAEHGLIVRFPGEAESRIFKHTRRDNFQTAKGTPCAIVHASSVENPHP